ncbi:hypothetical protein [Kitasatospora purpeofusca]|uniref:hypothetical protein n=1 Tax=Kitasatospora purpeofusca TaxID=67352 RepID=UPI0022550B9E|nr:hypothetical protein [Kitasatospora purpeofusca]MCX4757552.1 hypothetical protein [Kitasatospora purpeofusca]WSR34726.1 hypothetical protein OG715_29455 [Kitasatospora purpeofusca]WSR42935.1 hypothetical protein OG196_29925 [Kitasatospora purpeofusca]
MALHASPQAQAQRAVPIVGPPERADRDGERLLKEFNQAVRRPDEFGGLSTVARLLDRIAASEQSATGPLWIPDTNARLAPSAMLRGIFPDPDISVIASQYGEDAHRRGWLQLDRRLTPAEHATVVDRAVAWSETDRSLVDILAEFGPPSVTFGPPERYRPKTLSYATDDPSAPVVAFHLGSAQAESDPGSGDRMAAGADLLAVRIRDDLRDGWKITPSGVDRFVLRAGVQSP